MLLFIWYGSAYLQCVKAHSHQLPNEGVVLQDILRDFVILRILHLRIVLNRDSESTAHPVAAHGMTVIRISIANARFAQAVQFTSHKRLSETLVHCIHYSHTFQRPVQNLISLLKFYTFLVLAVWPIIILRWGFTRTNEARCSSRLNPRLHTPMPSCWNSQL